MDAGIVGIGIMAVLTMIGVIITVVGTDISKAIKTHTEATKPYMECYTVYLRAKAQRESEEWSKKCQRPKV